jgi:hypothetical protein
MDASNKEALHMATAPQPSINFHARIDLDTEECRRRLQERTGFSAPLLVRAAFQELERHLNLPSDSGTTTSALGRSGRTINKLRSPASRGADRNKQ